MTWTIVYRARSLFEAENIRLMLRSSGLDVNIWDSYLGSMNPWLTYALGGLRVVVPGDQAETARAMIAEHDRGAGAGIPDEELTREALAAPPPSVPPLRKPSFSDVILVVLLGIFALVIVAGLLRFLG